MKTLNKLVILISVALTCQLFVQAQTWQPAVRLWGASMNNVIVQVPNGPPLIPLWRGPNATSDSTLLYAIPTLNESSHPYEKQLSFLSYHFSDDFNGNGSDDVFGSPLDKRNSLCLDVFTGESRCRSLSLENGPIVRYDQLTSRMDVDGDGLIDIYSQDGDYGQIAYGDRSEPFLNGSLFPVRENKVQEKTDNVIALGRLSGKVCMVKLVWFEPMQGSSPKAKYVLEELDADDLRMRRDTIRTHVLREIVPEKGFAYQSPVILCDSVWWVGSPDQSVPTMISFTIDGVNVHKPDISWSRMSDYGLYEPYVYGQGRQQGQYPVVVDGKRPYSVFLSWPVSDSLTTQWVMYHTINDPSLLSSNLIDSMDLADTKQLGGGMHQLTLTPDVDGDGLDDIIVSYIANHPILRNKQDVVDFFLTTGRVMTSIPNTVPTTEIPNAVRTGEGWLITAVEGCAHVGSTLPIYTSDGRLVSMVVPRFVVGGLIIPHHNTTAVGVLFTVIGKCAIRLP